MPLMPTLTALRTSFSLFAKSIPSPNGRHPFLNHVIIFQIKAHTYWVKSSLQTPASACPVVLMLKRQFSNDTIMFFSNTSLFLIWLIAAHWNAAMCCFVGSIIKSLPVVPWLVNPSYNQLFWPKQAIWSLPSIYLFSLYFVEPELDCHSSFQYL